MKIRTLRNIQKFRGLFIGILAYFGAIVMYFIFGILQTVNGWMYWKKMKINFTT